MRVRPNEKSGASTCLSAEKEYYVIGINHEEFRVVNDRGEPFLFSRDIFDIIDRSIPSDWIWDRYSDDEYYASPAELHAPGFFEDLFDHKEEAVRQFESYMRRVRTETREEDRGEKGDKPEPVSLQKK